MSKFFAFRFPKVRIEWSDQNAATADANRSSAQQTAAPSPSLPAMDAETSGSTQPVITPQAPQPHKKSGIFSRKSIPPDTPPRTRPLLVRMLSLKIGQALNLLLWCVIVGAVMRLTNFNPLQSNINAGETAGNIWQQGLAALGWMIRTGWRPALTGAVLVLPIWLSWRIITLPFRK